MGPNLPAIEDEDPTIEEEGIDFEPTRTDQFDANRVAPPKIASNPGAVTFDERGQALWKWATEAMASAPDDRTFDQIGSLRNDALTLEQPKNEAAADEPRKGGGYNPYNTAKPGDPSKR
jgi:hypothetical protein